MTQAELSTFDVRQLLIDRFLEQTGYSMNDVLSLSYVDNLFLTRNGGKYRITEEGIEHLKGPSPDPSERM